MLKEKRYMVEVIVSHREILWAENKNEAIEKAQEKVFEKNVEREKGDLILGYKFIKRVKN